MKKRLIFIAALLLTLGSKAENHQDTDTLKSSETLFTSTGKAGENRPNHFTLNANLMARGEMRRGGLPVTDVGEEKDRANFVVERARLILGYERDFLQARVSIQHEGLWGSESNGELNIYEAWAQLKTKNGFFTRVGRQELVYDDERILGNDDWAMAALSHDVLKVGYEGHGHKAHAFFAYNQNNKNVIGGNFYKNGAQPYKSMQAVWYHYDVPKIPLGVSLIFMNVGMQSGTEEKNHTTNQQLFGGYLKFKPKRFSLEASYYRQTGKASLNYESGMDLPLKAWMAGVKTGYDFNSYVSAYAGYDYLSGDKEFVVPEQGAIGMTLHSKITAFTSIFGSSHKFYGAMDFFYVSAYYGTNSPGLQNLYGGVTIKPVKNLSIDAAYHYMSIASNLTNLKKTLGHELEVFASYKIMRDVSVAAGYSYMKGSETMERLKRSTDKRQMHWAWLMLSISPRIFSAKW